MENANFLNSFINPVVNLYSKNKSKAKNISKKKIYKNKVQQSKFFMIALNGSYMLSLVCMVLFRDHEITAGMYVKIIFIYTLVMVLFGLFYLPYKMKYYGFNTWNLRYNITRGFPLALIGVCAAVYIRYLLVENGRSEFAFNPNPEWELYIYPISVIAQETMTKGFLQNYFEHMFDKTEQSKLISISLSSLIFSLMHLMYGFIIMGLSFLFSVMLGIFFDKSKSLIGVFIVHFLIGTAMFYFKY